MVAKSHSKAINGVEEEDGGVSGGYVQGMRVLVISYDYSKDLEHYWRYCTEQGLQRTHRIIMAQEGCLHSRLNRKHIEKSPKGSEKGLVDLSI